MPNIPDNKPIINVSALNIEDIFLLDAPILLKKQLAKNKTMGQ